MQPFISLTHTESLAIKRGENTYFVSGIGSDGNSYHAYIVSTPEQMKALREDAATSNVSDSLLDLAFNGATLEEFLDVSQRMLLKLDNYGKVLAWNYGAIPGNDILGFLKTVYNLEIIPPNIQ
jgi:hypothetical protein